jgi:putative methionine-R-sulfoxide reductase with GAF domain
MLASSGHQVSHSRQALLLVRPESVFVNDCKAEESIPQAYVACQASTTNRIVVPARQAGNQFLGFLNGLQYGL